MKVRGEGSTLNGFLDKGSRLKGELHFEETFIRSRTGEN